MHFLKIEFCDKCSLFLMFTLEKAWVYQYIADSLAWLEQKCVFSLLKM